jgi:effector-binding domain-containing protein
MSYQCEVIDMQPQPTLAIRTRSTFHHLPKTISDGFATLRTSLRERDTTAAGPMYVKYVGKPAHEIEVEIGVAVGDAVLANGTTEPSSLPGCRAASCVHRGHYTDLPHAYTALEHWVAEQQLTPGDVAYELYLNDPEHTPPTAWLTRIAMPLG